VTAPSTAVVLAYRDSGCPHRQAAYRYVTDHVWRGFSEVRVCDSGSAPFSRGGSFNQGAERSAADVLVFSDADVVPGGMELAAAIATAADSGATVYPYTEYVRLSPKGTDVVIAREWLGHDNANFDWPDPVTNSVGGIFVVRRDSYLSVGGCDPRFVGWGFEDVAWSATSATLLGDHARIAGDLLHLWHPWDPHSGPAQKHGAEREVYEANVALCDRYTGAIGDVEAMRAIRAEAEVGVA
jgi:hypothetical protein